MTAATTEFAEHVGDDLVHALEIVADVGIHVDPDAFQGAGWQWLGIEFADHDLILIARTGKSGARRFVGMSADHSADRNIIDTIRAASCPPENGRER
jgi:hypothetical protein